MVEGRPSQGEGLQLVMNWGKLGTVGAEGGVPAEREGVDVLTSERTPAVSRLNAF